jgi:hypothetical protein
MTPDFILYVVVCAVVGALTIYSAYRSNGH